MYPIDIDIASLHIWQPFSHFHMYIRLLFEFPYFRIVSSLPFHAQFHPRATKPYCREVRERVSDSEKQVNANRQKQTRKSKGISVQIKAPRPRLGRLVVPG